MDDTRPDHTAVFFDLGGAKDRLLLHPEYKAQRAAMPGELARQIEPAKVLTRALGLAAIEQDGVESDDLLASCAVARASAGDEVIIVSSDKDFAQVVGERVKILLPPPSAQPKLGWRMLDAAGVSEKFGVPPSKIADYLSLVGDSSDNIPGVGGVGPKTAIKWLERHGDLDGVLAAADRLEPERFRSTVSGAAERLRLNRRLVTLNLALPLPSVEQKPVDVDGLLAFLREMEMRTTLKEAVQRYGQPELF